ncbi:MAG: cupin domain-containing protein [Planctomycetes bacterium]|nr:cupin domain-containing protein [Planctomycetota bacterium]
MDNEGDEQLLDPARPLDLASMVEYQTGSTVSRELAKTSGGTVTLFAFDSGQGLSEHTAPFDALVLIVDGQGQLTIGGETVEPDKGELVLMPADVPHSLQAEQRFKMLLVMLRGD